MVEQLGYDDHNMAKALENYTDIQPADNQTVGLIAQMFAVIERMSKKNVSRDNKEGNKRACVANALDTLGINTVGRNRDKPWGECRSGSNCNFKGCKFTHSGDNNGSNNKQMFDNSNKTGGKCEAAGCPAKGEAKRLCTTCFKSLLANVLLYPGLLDFCPFGFLSSGGSVDVYALLVCNLYMWAVVRSGSARNLSV